jgi:hypothetical protein
MNQPGPYTRGGQVLKPTEVEYLFRAVNDDLQSVENRLRSLSTHFAGVDDKVRDRIEIAVSNTITARSMANIAKREGMPKIMPHRDHAGEHEHW